MPAVMFPALGHSIPLPYLFAVIPVINIICSAPLSLNGLGIREAMYLVLLSPVGVTPQGAAACGALWFAILSILGLSGGLGLLIVPNKRHRSHKANSPLLRSWPLRGA